MKENPMRKSLLAALAVAFSLGGCGLISTLTGSPTVTLQNQQVVLDGLKTSLTAANDAATACITSGVALCVTNKVAIKAGSLTADGYINNAQAVINSGGSAATLIGAIQAEYTTFQTLYPHA
jgi:uncharacterized lipoprotein YajG